MRAPLLALFVVALAGAATRADDEPGSSPRLAADAAVEYLRDFVRANREGRAPEAWARMDAEVLARRAFGPALERASDEERTLVVDLVARGLPAMVAREPMPWAAPDVAIDDHRASSREDGTVEATFAWRADSTDPPQRWGLVLARAADGIRPVDLVFGPPDATRTCSEILADGARHFTEPAGDLATWLRSYFRLPLPGTAVPPDAPVDWASPDVLALDLVEPTVRGAEPDGWYAYARGADAPSLAYRSVVHVLADGTVRWRWDWFRWGGARPLATASARAGEASAVLAVFQPLPPVLVRADRRTPWADVRTVLRALPSGEGAFVAFAVLRAEAEGRARRGQLGATPEGAVPVVASRADLEARGGLPRPSPRAVRGPVQVTVRLSSRPAERGDGATEVGIVGVDAWGLVLGSDPPARAAALDALVSEVRGLLGTRRHARVLLDVPAPAGDRVPHGDVVAVLAALRRLPGSVVDLALPPPERSAVPEHAAGPEPPPAVAWTLPAGWVERPRRALRAVTAAPSEAARSECYVVVLSGEAGGWKANLRRWYAQMGVDVPDDEALEAVERVPTCGREGRFVAIAGAHRPVRGDALPDALLYGVVCHLDAATVFVKMVGPRTEVEPERERFLALCASLRLTSEAR